MYRIADARGTGKTCQLLLLAKENNGVIVCIHPKTMKEQAERYGLVGIDYLSYSEYIKLLKRNDKTISERKIFIDELEYFLSNLNQNIAGYTVSLE